MNHFNCPKSYFFTPKIYEVTSCNLANLQINKLQFGTADLSGISKSLPEDIVGIISL